MLLFFNDFRIRHYKFQRGSSVRNPARDTRPMKIKLWVSPVSINKTFVLSFLTICTITTVNAEILQILFEENVKTIREIL